MPKATLRFDYHRSVAPMLWVFFGLACTELLVVHSLLALWWPRLAFAVSAVTLLSIIWLARAIASFRSRPVLLQPDDLVMRVGRLREVVVPLDQLAGLRESWTGDDLNKRSVLNLALIAYPNVVIDLAEPIVNRWRTVAAIAHRFDDPVAFTTALRDRLAKRQARDTDAAHAQ
jgi:hypothetical protein